MKRTGLAVLVVCLASWGLPACGGKNSGNAPGGGGAGSGGSGGTGGSGGSGGGGVDAAGGSGGGGGSGGSGGGQSTSRGAGGTGGDSGSGGGGTGGGGGSGGAGGSAGNGGTGGSLPVPCEDQSDCDAPNPFCEPLLGVCVACFASDQCAMDERCVDNACESACSDDGDCDSARPVCDGEGVCVECADEGDCSDDETCVEGACVPVVTCGNSLDCPDGEVCDQDRSQCVGCVSDGDCGDAEACVDDSCVPACASDRVCTPLGQLCDFDGGYCVECLAHSDCPEAAHCVDGSCETDSCTPGAERCGDGEVQKCDAEGIGYETQQTCSSDQSCADDGSGPSCEDWVCTPSATECQTNRIVIECSDDGLSVLSSVDCEQDGQYCVNGECSDRVCQPSELFCNDGDVHLCDSDGLDSSVYTTCGSQQYCDDASTPSCVDWACVPDEAYCDANTALVCDSMGTGPVDAGTACTSDQTCLDGACEDQVCEPDSAECYGSGRLVCASDGLSESLVPCAGDEFCNDETVTCDPQLCVPDELTCNGNAVTTCNSDGSGYTGGESDCGAQTCFSGACQDAYLFEDFEDGDYDGWVEGTTSFTRTVTNTQAADGTNYSLQMTGGVGDHYEGLNYLFDDIRPTYVAYWARPTSTSGATTYFVLSESTVSDPSSQIVFIMFNDGDLFVAGPDVSLGGYSANQWYHIEMDIDWSLKTIDFTVDDALVQTAVPFRAPSVSGVGMLSLYHYTSSTGYWDEITVR